MIGMPGVILKLRNCDFLKLLDALWVSIRRGSFIHPWRVYGYLVSTVKLSLFCILNRRVHQRQEEVFQERGGVHKEELWKEAKWLRWYLKLPPDLNVLLKFIWELKSSCGNIEWVIMQYLLQEAVMYSVWAEYWWLQKTLFLLWWTRSHWFSWWQHSWINRAFSLLTENTSNVICVF